MLKHGLSPDIQGVLERGSLLLFDKTETLNKLSQQSSSFSPKNAPPTQEDFSELVNNYLYHAL